MTRKLDIETFSGLSEAEAASRLATDGHNELPSGKHRGLLATAFGVVREPMFLLLVACGVIYLLLGDVQEAMMLLAFVFVVMGITLYQERKSERALDALRDLSSPRALVVRDGRERRIAGRDVVKGDVIILHEGDRIPADVLLLSGANLAVDESLLTGESVPVRKSAGDAPDPAIPARPGGDDLPFLFSGTLVVQGQGIARVTAVGSATELGKIGKAIETVETKGTRLQKEVARIVQVFALVGVVLCGGIVVVYGLTRGDWLNGFLAGITLAMAILPEEFLAVLTIFMALGAWRISRSRVLTRRVPAIESLGAATVLCVDKTGTLTTNQMTVVELLTGDRRRDLRSPTKKGLEEAFHELVEFGILASQRDPFDPMDKAIREVGIRHLADTEHLHGDWTLVQEYPLTKKLLALSHVWQSPRGDDYVIAAKGAPEAIADLCHLDPEAVKRLDTDIATMADKGLRVLGVARAKFRQSDLPGQQHAFRFELVGLIGLADPVRPTVPAAIQECYAAGIRVVMITGDYPGTALNIALDIGLRNRGKVITGPELNDMAPDELQRRAMDTNVFARMVPEQKLKLVEALKAQGEIVAMTGDGVNDAPALKAADIGIAMGGRGSDVARESAALVLLDDDFGSIVQAVRLGRRIFDNIRKAMAYIFAVHVPIAGMSLMPVLFKLPLVLLPVHILFLELIIDPACSTVFEAEPEEANVMSRPPRNPSERLFGWGLIGIGVLQGLSVFLVVFAVYAVALFRNQGVEEARAMSYTTLVIANLALIVTNRSWTRGTLATLRAPNAALRWVLGGAVLFLSLALSTPFLRHTFKFALLHPNDILLCLGAGLLSTGWFEILKLLRTRDRRRSEGHAAT